MSKLLRDAAPEQMTILNEQIEWAREGKSVGRERITIAVAEKISAIKTEQFFIERAKGADLGVFRKFLFRQGVE